MKLNRHLLVAVTTIDGLLALLGVYCILQGWIALAIVLFVAGGMLVTSFIVLSIVSQTRQQQRPFEAGLRLAGLSRRADETVERVTLGVLQRFPEIGQVDSIEKLHAAQTQAGPVFAGCYQQQGMHTSEGYFLAAILNLRKDPNLTLAKLLKSPQEFDMALQLNIRETPSEIEATLERFPYESHCSNNFVLFTFTEDDVRATDFGTNVHEVLAAISGSTS